MLLEVQNLSKTKESFRLHNISFSLPEGYIMGLIGPNGAGKTTLIHSILGLNRMEEGNIQVDGMNITEDEKNVKDSIGYVLAEDLFLADMTLVQNADLFGRYYERYSRDEFLAYCERFGLLPNHKLKKLSRGQKLKFQFAFALSYSPKLLILDEPTANFDPDFRTEFLKILSDFISDGKKSVLLATHVMEDLDRLADYITFLNEGKLILSSSREEIEEHYRLVSGEDYKINLLSEEHVIYKEKGEYASRALVHHNQFSKYDAELQVEVPSMDDIFYYMTKGGGENV